MRHVRRQQRDPRPLGGVLVPLEIKADRPAVHQEQRPGVVGVHRIRVIGKVSVQNLSDPRNRRVPSTQSRRRRHGQERTRPPIRGGYTLACVNDTLLPPFDTKVAVLVRNDLATWQRLNVTAFLASGIAAASPQLIGQAYADADAHTYLALLGIPVLIFEGGADVLAAAGERALRREVPLAIYTADMFRTGHDQANRSVVAAVAGTDLDLVGIAVHGPKNAVDKILKGGRLHP